MVEKRQPPIAVLPYRPSADAPFGIEVMSFAGLRSMSGTARRAPTRPQFHVLAVVEAGFGHLTVDFVRRDLGPGSVVWIRPGQVHELDGIDSVGGALILFQPDLLPLGTIAQAAADDVFGATGWLVPEGRSGLALEHLRSEYRDGAGDRPAARVEVLRQLLAVLILKLLPGGAAPAAGNDVFARFRAAVERDFATCRTVAEFGKRLGYAPRTLSRATLAAVGAGAKEFIDGRVVLEAKRLLAHADVSAAGCARQLGFDDAANFSKFFQQHAGVSPGAFRAAMREAE